MQDFIGYYVAKKGGAGPDRDSKIGYRSELELGIMRILDASPDVDCWEYETLEIPCGSTFTKPDFIVQMVDNTGRLVEGKGKHLVEKSREKIEAAKQWCEERGALYFLVTQLPPWTLFFPDFAYIKGSPSYRVAFVEHLYAMKKEFGE